MIYKDIEIYRIEIYDKAGNFKTIQGYELEKNKINIADSSGLIDEKAPVLNGIEFSKDMVKAGESVDIYIDAVDELSGIECIKASLNIGAQYKYVEFIYDKSRENINIQQKRRWI